jgi:hypothetical protein
MPGLFLGEGFEATVYHISRLVVMLDSSKRPCPTRQDHLMQAACVLVYCANEHRV